MVKRRIAPHPKMGIAKAAVAAREKVRRESRKAILNSPFTAVKKAWISLLEERAWFHPVKGIFTIAFIPLDMAYIIMGARLRKRLGANLIAFALKEEAKRDPKFKNALEEKMKDGYKWLGVSRKGQIYLSKSAKVRPSVREYQLRDLGQYPRVDFENYIKNAVPAYMNAAEKERETMISVLGSEIKVWKQKEGVSAIKASEIEKYEMKNDPKHPGKKVLTIETENKKTHDKTTHTFIVKEDEGKAILKRLGRN